MNGGVGGGGFNIIYTLQKCGTHLVSNICALLIDKDCDIYQKDKMYQIIPHYTGGNVLAKNRVISTHPNYLAYNNPNILRNRILSVIRNPVDVCISHYFYNECRRGRREIKEINAFVMLKIDGICQKMKDHIRFINRGNENENGTRLLLSYEKLVGKGEDKKMEIDRVRNFLIAGGVKVSDISGEEIIKKVNIEKTRVEEKKRGLYHVGVGQVFMFHRDGTVGQWQKYLRPDICDKVFQYIKIKYPGLYNRFYSNVNNYDSGSVDLSASGSFKTSADSSA